MWCPSKGFSFPLFHNHTCSDIKSSTTFHGISKLEKPLWVKFSVFIREGSSAGLEQDGILAIHVKVKLVAANLGGNLSIFLWDKTDEFIEMTREGAASLSTKKKVPHRLCIFPADKALRLQPIIQAQLSLSWCPFEEDSWVCGGTISAKRFIVERSYLLPPGIFCRSASRVTRSWPVFTFRTDIVRGKGPIPFTWFVNWPTAVISYVLQSHRKIILWSCITASP